MNGGPDLGNSSAIESDVIKCRVKCSDLRKHYGYFWWAKTTKIYSDWFWSFLWVGTQEIKSHRGLYSTLYHQKGLTHWLAVVVFHGFEVTIELNCNIVGLWFFSLGWKYENHGKSLVFVNCPTVFALKNHIFFRSLPIDYKIQRPCSTQYLGNCVLSTKFELYHESIVF